jgi:hypothetical protein
VRAALVIAALSLTSAAHALPPLAAPGVTRAVDRDALVAVGVAVADERIEGWASRCAAARTQATAFAKRALHAYVDDVLRDAVAPPAATVAAHEAVDRDARETDARTLVDCAASVEVSLPLARLREATSAWSMTW